MIPARICYSHLFPGWCSIWAGGIASQSLLSVAPPATPNALSFPASGLSFPSVAWPCGSRSVPRQGPKSSTFTAAASRCRMVWFFQSVTVGASRLHRALLVPEHPLERHSPVASWLRGRRPSSSSSQGSRRRCCPGDGGRPRAVPSSISAASSGSSPLDPHSSRSTRERRSSGSSSAHEGHFPGVMSLLGLPDHPATTGPSLVQATHPLGSGRTLYSGPPPS